MSYGLTGAGQTVAILDSGYMINGFGYTGTTHYDLNGDTDENGSVDNSFTVSGYGSYLSYSSSNSHGTQVAGAAVGDYGDGGIMGVGHGAKLHLSDFAVNFQPSHWEAATEK